MSNGSLEIFDRKFSLHTASEQVRDVAHGCPSWVNHWDSTESCCASTFRHQFKHEGHRLGGNGQRVTYIWRHSQVDGYLRRPRPDHHERPITRLSRIPSDINDRVVILIDHESIEFPIDILA